MNSTNTSSPKRKSAPSRKKSCLQCAKSKIRCGNERPACARCVSAKRQCRYAAPPEGLLPSAVSSRQSVPPLQSVATPLPLSTALTDPTDIHLVGTTLGSPSTPLATQLRASSNDVDTSLDFSNLDLVPLADADQIRDRWLRPFFSVGEQVPKIFLPYTLQYISCVLRAYPRQMTEENGIPPIFHPMQIAEGSSPVALANCYSLVRLWQHRATGSEAIVAETIQREMDRLAHYVSSYQPCDRGKGDELSLTRLLRTRMWEISTPSPLFKRTSSTPSWHTSSPSKEALLSMMPQWLLCRRWLSVPRRADWSLKPNLADHDQSGNLGLLFQRNVGQFSLSTCSAACTTRTTTSPTS